MQTHDDSDQRSPSWIISPTRWPVLLWHGPLGLLILPPLLALAVVGFDRWQTKRERRPPSRRPVRFWWVLALAYIGALSHPLLDWLNVYGIRLLMPFSERWFYGDTLFIIDPWLWLSLSLGIWLTIRRERRGSVNPGLPATLALLTFAAYCGAMMGAGRSVEAFARDAIIADGHGHPQRVLASPTAVNPFRWDIVFEVEDGYPGS
ncbi:MULTISPECIES: metal-dependent hydrolase [unclassified Shinella]|uniref:metal-dependent hydrolase n=1 Tax=unclassified Shinella TaxID=2643062 RepID=UPI0018D14BDA|nr:MULTISPECIES: metal-dependent hydrolase [unclassified Shinella]